MILTKPHLDVGLFTNRRDEQLEFWQSVIGLKSDHMAKLGDGIQQHRHFANESIVKVNHAREPLRSAPASGIVAAQIARSGQTGREEYLDADGYWVLLVPRGAEGVEGIAIELAVRNRDAHDHFWRHVMQFSSPEKGIYLCGDTWIFIVQEQKIDRSDTWQAPGWRYLTVQVRDRSAEHAGVLARGGEEGLPPRTLGEVQFSFVRDPDGIFIELSQRASLIGMEV